ncbi:hypothetical protein MLD38_005150 [Melastoma candidum]|uniref:Uncharacterized protein n=1 Tax=Melastoma candidum TaxID=119954 RepID=A0ACB9S9H8_9MYRT|nr:hypothetical protein MLD38_005150 [Melastoma candidum]
MNNKTKSPKIRAALLSSPGMGHLIPVTELGKRLVCDHGWDVTVFALSSGESKGDTQPFEIVEMLPPDISTVIGQDAAVVTLLAVMMRAAIPVFRSALAQLDAQPDVLIVDIFGVDHLEIGKELGIPSYIYCASNTWFLSLLVYCPILDKEVKGEYLDRTEPLEIPGCKAVQPVDVPDPMLDRSNQQYHEFLLLGEKITHGDGILVNVWEDFQPDILQALQNQDLLGRIIRVPIFAIGPLVRPPTEELSTGHKVFDWLDKQPRESVIYLSFGSAGTLSPDQLTELAWGLDLSGQRFIWVIRPPTSATGVGSYLGNTDETGDISSVFPAGFLSRVQDVGFLIPLWAPQVDILRHPSVGGFLSHCGWSSALESITNGVPMVAWPLYAEQRMNAALLTEEVGVAVKPKALPTNDTIRREEIKDLVKMIMVEEEGRGIRTKAKEIKESAHRALSKSGGRGYSSSYGTLARFTEECKGKRLTNETATDPSKSVFVNGRSLGLAST